MRRPEFIAPRGAAVAWPLAGTVPLWPSGAQAQVSTQRPLVALLFGASATSPVVLSNRSAFLQGLRELGYVESTPVRLACTTNLAD